ncbi:hypothetical protein V8B55DRAFT_1590358 [Mucor lusitanicus]|uniref:Uncharacterized protein n=2 Tax=Mucor circinelloides f. lusitanicus TaxID=29924 RepID=A0A168N960_MUCCL|nr:hypothetical protein FB192DRAFT_1460019 [Mucor lusitanicus]OAD05969.1 hypothetical protein MUCCIDRAFT_159662 [Mucor lusitanicus CBS 277.49]
MVKSSLIVASLATVGSVVMAQSATPTAVGGVTLPTAIPSNLSGVPSGVADAVSSLIKNPAGINSYISVASQQVSQLPSQYQASAYSALSAASKSVAAIQPTKSAGATSAAGSNAAPVSFAVGALAIIAVLASLL